MHVPKISVVIPVYNEAGEIGPLLRYLRHLLQEDGHAECVVVDGGSTDDTREEVQELGFRIVQSPVKGRAAQLNYGAGETSGEIIYFLHADSYPPAAIFKLIRRRLKSGSESGCCRLQFDEQGFIMRLYGWFTRFDLLAFRYGDQGLFVKREVFKELAGFREELIVMEDNDFIRLLRKRKTFALMPETVTTSARKYRGNGFVRLQLIFAVIFILFYCGASQKSLVRFYRFMITNPKS